MIGYLIGVILTGCLALGTYRWGHQTGFQEGVRHQRQVTARAVEDIRSQEDARARDAQAALDYLYGRARADILSVSGPDQRIRRGQP